jgi:hypothetical protein
MEPICTPTDRDYEELYFAMFAEDLQAEAEAALMGNLVPEVEIEPVFRDFEQEEAEEERRASGYYDEADRLAFERMH